jgi:hypothetical protein
MEHLFLEDLKDYTHEQVQEHLQTSWSAPKEEVEQYEILIAYESVGCSGCDSTGFFLLKHKETGRLYEVHGGHCSCYGFEDQFEPKETTVKYLTSDMFCVYTGGYDGYGKQNKEDVKEFIEKYHEEM